MVRDNVKLTGTQLLILSLMVNVTSGRTDTVVSRKELGQLMGFWNCWRTNAAYELIALDLLLPSYRWTDHQLYYSITSKALEYFPRADRLFSPHEYYQEGML